MNPYGSILSLILFRHPAGAEPEYSEYSKGIAPDELSQLLEKCRPEQESLARCFLAMKAANEEELNAILSNGDLVAKIRAQAANFPKTSTPESEARYGPADLNSLKCALATEILRTYLEEVSKEKASGGRVDISYHSLAVGLRQLMAMPHEPSLIDSNATYDRQVREGARAGEAYFTSHYDEYWPETAQFLESLKDQGCIMLRGKMFEHVSKDTDYEGVMIFRSDLTLNRAGGFYSYILRQHPPRATEDDKAEQKMVEGILHELPAILENRSTIIENIARLVHHNLNHNLYARGCGQVGELMCVGMLSVAEIPFPPLRESGRTLKLWAYANYLDQDTFTEAFATSIKVGEWEPLAKAMQKRDVDQCAELYEVQARNGAIDSDDATTVGSDTERPPEERKVRHCAAIPLAAPALGPNQR